MASERNQRPAGPGRRAEPAGAGRRTARLAGVQVRTMVELLVLTSLVIAQPLLDVVGRSPDLFLFRRAGRADIVLLAVAVTMLPPLALWAAEAAAGLASRRLRSRLHLGVVTGLLVLLALEVTKKLTPLRGKRVVVVLAVAAGLLVGFLYARGPWIKLWLRYLTPAPLVFLLLFLLVSPVSRLVLPARAATPGARGRHGRAGRAATGGDDRLRRVPALVPAGLAGPRGQACLPELRQAGRRFDLVS